MGDGIDSKYNAFFGSIEQKIAEVLLTRGDLSLVGELASLKDRTQDQDQILNLKNVFRYLNPVKNIMR